MSRMIPGVVAAAAVLTGVSGALAQGGRVYAGSLNGAVLTGFGQVGQFGFLGLCSGPIRAMTRDANVLLLGTTSGDVYRFDLASGQVLGSFTLPTPPTAMAMHGAVLVVGAETGPILRVDPSSGVVLGSFAAPVGGVHAMQIQGDTLFVGAHNTFVSRGNAKSGGFQMLTVCGGAVDSMTIANGELVLGTLTNTVYRVNTVTGAYYGTFMVQEPQTAMVTDGAHVLVGSGTGNIRRINPLTGAVGATYTAPLPIRTMVIEACPADINADGKLTVQDFGAFQSAFVLGDLRSDFDTDGALTVTDFGAFQTAFVAGCPSVP